MTHLEVENLTSDYLDGRLEPALKREVEAHLSACPSCLEMVEDVRRVLEQCHSAPELEPAPRLIAKIMLATVGERKPTLAERLAVFFRPVLQPRFAYGVAMAVFSFSIIVNAAGISLRHMTVEDLNPRTWFFRADRVGHLYIARVEKFICDVQVVYEIESRLGQLRSRPEEEQEAPKQEPAAGGSSNTAPLTLPTLAANPPWAVQPVGRVVTLRHGIRPKQITFE
jgi:hypothetical protein